MALLFACGALYTACGPDVLVIQARAAWRNLRSLAVL
jgi:hypothetical protein